MDEGIPKEDYRLEGDAHADCCIHRQVSFLGMESIEKMRRLGFKVGPGDFDENLTTQRVELVSLPVGTEISVGKNILLEVTQIGKECQGGCTIRQQIGKSVVSMVGIFARVIHGSCVSAGNDVRIEQHG